MSNRILPIIVVAPGLALLLLACGVENQRPVVGDFNDRSQQVRVVCLDVNSDGAVNQGDIDLAKLPDITGDGESNDQDASVVGALNISLAKPKPADCDKNPNPDWQVTEPADVNCRAGEAGIVLLAIGGGPVDLAQENTAAGVRWMMVELADELEDKGVRVQLASVAPALNGTPNGHADAEAFAEAYVSELLRRAPCVQVVMLGHSHGGGGVTAIAAGLEQAGFAKNLLMTVVVDRVTAQYRGDTASLPQTVRVFNAFQNEGLHGEAISQPNAENWDASGEGGPAEGDLGGDLKPIDHGNIDNSPDVLDRVQQEVIDAACGATLCG